TILFDSHGTVTVTNGCPDTQPSGAYVFQTALEVLFIGNISNTSTSWIDLRQDARGLYGVKPPSDAIPSCGEAAVLLAGSAPTPDAIASQALARLPARITGEERARMSATILDLARGAAAFEGRLRGRPGPREGEAQLLAYPLHPGQRWSYAAPGTDHLFNARVTGFGRYTVPAGSWRATRVTAVWVDGGPGYHDDSWYAEVGLLRAHHHQEGNGVIFEGDQVLTQVDLAPTH
ncbi:MAG: hypothetical protein ACHQ52_15200, partial [Candidatus Eisenbacteria bacterium]